MSASFIGPRQPRPPQQAQRRRTCQLDVTSRKAKENLIIHLNHPAMMTRYGCGIVRAQA